MVSNTLFNKTFQDKVFKIFSFDYGSKTPSKDIKRRKDS